MSTFGMLVMFQFVAIVLLLGVLSFIALHISERTPVNSKRVILWIVIVTMVGVMVVDILNQGNFQVTAFVVPTIVIVIAASMLARTKK
ncbi:hypothetical protein [Geomicrobium sediminis]|uniref:Membrane-associated HD superfamily phosphohydrolase n=1 Tax=Geomicrobium sediminis TaxID=1347788 RepID=A0ABS2PBZ2_9BACL|nr:hypothetical protein [Geomicrobium sediminis]MBM7632918.1 membrane-associated HD superfamily phosphohydrolase [Geomicrobium sediminis]